MANVEILARSAIQGIPPDPLKQPSGEGVIAAFAEVENRISAAELAIEDIGAGAGLDYLRFATVADMTAVTNSADGQIAYVYNNNSDPADSANGFYQWDDVGNVWVVADWLLIGIAAAAGIISDSDDNRFFGNAGNTTLSGLKNTGGGVAAVNSITSGNRNTGLGYNAGTAITTADDVTAIGQQALVQATGIRNSAVGSEAGNAVTSGDTNSFLGYGAGSGVGQLATAVRSIAIGAFAYTTQNLQLAFPDDVDEVRMFGTVYMRGYLSKRAWFMGEGAGNRSMGAGGAVVGIGSVALASITVGTQLTAVGDYAMNSMTSGNNSTAMGAQSMRYGTTLTDCTAFGSLTLRSAVSGVGDTAIGFRALEYATVARNNSVVGDSALWLSQGASNIAMGYRVAEYPTSGDLNVFLGAGCSVNRLDGDQNVYVGAEAGGFPGVTPNPTTGVGAQTAGDGNVGLGYRALRNATGDDNIAIGRLAGDSLTTASGSIFIGEGAGTNVSQKVDAVNSIAIGQDAFTTANNEIVLGNSSIIRTTLRGYVRMAEVTAPSAPLSNEVLLYGEDNGAGKTRLMALFSSGAAQQVAIQP